MAEWEDAISNACFTFVSISSNLILGTIDDYILRGKIVPYPAKIDIICTNICLKNLHMMN